MQLSGGESADERAVVMGNQDSYERRTANGSAVRLKRLVSRGTKTLGYYVNAEGTEQDQREHKGRETRAEVGKSFG